MAHAVAHHGLSGAGGNSHGNRRSKQHDRNFEAVFGMNNSRRSGSRPQLRSHYSGMAMGACSPGVSLSSGTHSDQTREASMTCTQLIGLRVVSILSAITGVALIFFGLFLIPGTKILALCIPGGFLVFVALLIWCIMYVRHGRCCTKNSDSASLGGHPVEGATQRPARGSTEEGPVNLRVDIPPSSDVMTSYGPDTRIDHQHSYSPPPKYHQMGRCASFPTSGGNMGQPPSTPPPPYNEIT
ncbi:uncharacterized protein LOC119724789 [Patiria miniata]|uniref:Uncharacterized protein n=1 Tax=Patiria miniata TaxID=46514 RepID=A0A913ZLF4_PATMI|nr:uncharacterized protein LOC119724789 [Patiria miniata]